MTRRDAIDAALRDHMAALGTIIHPGYIMGYRGRACVDIKTDETVAAKVVPMLPDAICYEIDGSIGSYWEIEIISDPKGLLTGIRSIWCFGPSYEYSSEKV